MHFAACVSETFRSCRQYILMQYLGMLTGWDDGLVDAWMRSQELAVYFLIRETHENWACPLFVHGGRKVGYDWKAAAKEVAEEVERLLLEQGGDSRENWLAVLHCGDFVSLMQFDDLLCVAACPWEVGWVACRWNKK